MKNKRKLIHRIGALLCALVVAFSAFGVSGSMYASETHLYVGEDYYIDKVNYSYDSEELPFTYNLWAKRISNKGNYETKSGIYASSSELVVYRTTNVQYDSEVPSVVAVSKGHGYDVENGGRYYIFSKSPIYDLSGSLNNYVFTFNNGDVLYCSTWCFDYAYQFATADFHQFDCYIYESTDIRSQNDYGREVVDLGLITSSGKSTITSYNSDLGYLQNVDYDISYETSVFGSYDENSRTDRFRFDTITTSGLDLSDGNYSIRHYIRLVLCDSYEDDGVIEQYDKYLMGEYSASSGEFRYKCADYESKFEEFGYDGIGFVDAYLKGRFILEWHYLQIVNNDNNEVGGYVLMKPKNASGDFGVERVAITVDINEEIDIENGYDETIVDFEMGGGSTIEEGFESTDEAKLGDIDGVDELANVLIMFGQEASQFSYALGQFLNAYPSWCVVGIGIGMCLIVLAIVVKVIRG